MKKINEKQLQAAIAKRLSERGYSARREVPCAGVGFCDVVTDEWAIEVKPYLTRSAIDKAIGQVMAYSKSLDKKPVIAGLRPQSAAWKQAQITLKRAKSLGIEVWEVNSHPNLVEQVRSQKPQQNLVKAHDTEWSTEPFAAMFQSVSGVIVLGVLAISAISIMNQQEMACISANGFDGATVRSGPGESYQPLGIVPNGQCLPIGGHQDNWLFVKFEGGQQGWIHESAVKD